MAEEILEKAVCISCGADVRDGTYYCYACGKPVVAEVGEFNALEESEVASNSGNLIASKSEKNSKLATAAAERRRSRAGQRKPKQVVWEEPGTGSNRVFVLFCFLVFILAGGVVFLTIFMK